MKELFNLAEYGVIRTNDWLPKIKLKSRHRFLIVKTINHWNKLPKGVVDSPSLELSKSRQAAFLDDML